MSKIFKQPKGLYTVSFIEMWERFSFYGMRFCLVLFMVKELMFSQQKSSYVYGLYCSSAYLMPLICGYLVDRYIGLRKAITIGSFCRCFGLLMLSTGKIELFVLSLALIAIATGFMRAGMNPLVGLLYEKDNDVARDSGFRCFYIFANIGAFFSTLVCGYVGSRYGYRYAFLVAGLSILIGQVGYFLTAEKTLGSLGKVPIRKIELVNKNLFLTSAEKTRLLAMFIIFFVFITIYDICVAQQGNTVTVFAENNINRTIGDFVIPTPWFQAINPIVIWIFTPLIGVLMDRKALKNGCTNYTGKFTFALVLMGASYIVLMLAGYYADRQDTISMLWVIALVFVQTIGEIYIFPTQSSLVVKLSPKRFLSLCFGFMCLQICVSNFLSGFIGGLYSYMSKTSFFSIFMLMSFCFALLLFLLRKPLTKMIETSDKEN